MKKETFTIVRFNMHYDTNECKFYSDRWNRTQDDYEYLKMLMKHDPKKFEDCIIEDNEI